MSLLLAAVIGPATALAAGPYVTSTSLTTVHSSTCMPTDGGKPVQTGSTVAIPCTFQEITTTVTSYSEHIPHAVYATEQTGNAWEQVGWSRGIVGYHTAVVGYRTAVVGYHSGVVGYRSTRTVAAYRTFSYTERYGEHFVTTCDWGWDVWHLLRCPTPTGYWAWNYRTVLIHVPVYRTTSVPIYGSLPTYGSVPVYGQVPTYGLVARYGWMPTYAQVQVGTTWTTVAADPATRTLSTSRTLASWLDPTPAVGTPGSQTPTSGPGWNCSSGTCYYVIPIPAGNPVGSTSVGGQP
ncbi:MAG: hypothetical protein ACYCO4_00610 [Sulfobacillus sp.]